MNRPVRNIVIMFAIAAMAAGVSGCTIIFQKGRRSDVRKIEELSSQLDELNKAKNLLAQRLKKEIADKEVSLEMAEKGLVITFVADVLFDSGKAKLRSEAQPTLDKVARVLTENLYDYNIGVEGHTDNQPIKYSTWKSNWELSSARSLSVLHYIVEKKGVAPGKISGIAYGEYHPVAANSTKEGKQLNRRVEIVVLPRVEKVKEAHKPVTKVEAVQEEEREALAVEEPAEKTEVAAEQETK